MVSADFILSKLTPFRNNEKVIVKNQSVGDIKKRLYQWHYQNAGEYDKIYKYFLGDNPRQSATNVFNFIKKNVRYCIESDKWQTLRTPAAIVAPGQTVGADCKNYSLFTAGVLDAINRNTSQRIPLSFRFASYDLFDKTPVHVFTVVNPGREEIWVDPVLDYLDQRKDPSYYTDKKIKSMSLIALSGVGSTYTPEQIYNGLINERAYMVQRGRIRKGDMNYMKYTNAINAMADKLGKPRIGAFGWDDALVLIPGVINMFSQPDNSQNWTSTASKNDWAWWLLKDPSNHPANNFIVYLSKNPQTLGLEWRWPEGYAKQGQVITMPEKQQLIKDRLTAAGFGSQAVALMNAYNQNFDANGNPKTGSVVVNPDGSLTQTKASSNMWLTLALVGGGLLLVSKMKN